MTQRHVKRLPPLRLEVGREEAVLRGVELRAAGGSTADWHTFLDLAWPSARVPAPGAGLLRPDVRMLGPSSGRPHALLIQVE